MNRLLKSLRSLTSDQRQGEEFLDIGLAEQIGLCTELATDLGLPVGQSGPCFLVAEGMEHRGHPFP